MGIRLGIIFLLVFGGRLVFAELLPGCLVLEQQVVAVKGSFETFPQIYTNDLENYYLSLMEYKYELKASILNSYSTKQNELRQNFLSNTLNLKKSEYNVRLTAIKALDELSQSYNDTEEAPAVLLNLIILKYEKIIAEAAMGATAESSDSDKKFDLIINFCKQFETKFPQDKYLDVVLFIKSYLLTEAGRINEATEALEALIYKRPNSKLIPEASYNVAENYFKTENYDRANLFFMKLLPFKHESFYKNVLFRLGNIQYASKNYPKSLSLIIELLDLIISTGSNNDPPPVKYMQSSSIDKIASIFYAYGTKSNLDQFFKKIGSRPYEFLVYKRLGELYSEAGLYESARTIFRKATSKFYLNENAPLIQDRIIDTYIAQNNYQKVIEERSKMIQLFGQNSSWKTANKMNLNVVLEVDTFNEVYLLETASYYFKAGKETLNDKALSLAAETYKSYVNEYAKGLDKHKINLNIADAYFFMNDYKKAKIYYEKAIKKDCSSAFNGRALFGLVTIVLNEIHKKQGRVKIKKMFEEKSYKTSGLKPMPNEYLALFEHIEAFARLSDDKELQCQLALISGEEYYKFNDYDKSRPRFEEAVEICNDNNVRKKAMQYILASFEFEKNEEGVKKWKKLLR